MSAKLNIEFVKKQFEKEDYILLTNEYINNKQKLNYICSVGHEHSISWNNWQKNARCPYCAGQGKPTIESIRSEFEKEKYILLSKKYVNSEIKLKYICSNGHRNSISWNSWRHGSRCAYCVGNIKLNIDFIKKEFEKEKYILLTKKYINNNQKLNYICPMGHTHKISWIKWRSGCRCPYCSGLNKLTIEFVKKKFEKDNYKLLTKTYKNSHSKLEYICPNGHKGSIKWGNWQQGKRCIVCYKLNNFGPNNPSWKGGISCEPYCQDWTKEFKDFIKKRDGYKCLNPDCWGVSKRLTVHHIDYNKKNCEPQNLITLCNSCNSRANTQRNWHKAWYQAIIYRRYK